MQKILLTLAALLLTIAAVLLVLAPPIHAQSVPAPEPLGIWRGSLDGIPSVTLTLADDTGSLDGTIVFYAIDGKQKRAISIEPHTLLRTRLDGDTLTFQVRRPDAKLLTINVRFTAANKALLHCLDCGNNAPIAELTKDVL